MGGTCRQKMGGYECKVGAQKTPFRLRAGGNQGVRDVFEVCLGVSNQDGSNGSRLLVERINYALVGVLNTGE